MSTPLKPQINVRADRDALIRHWRAHRRIMPSAWRYPQATAARLIARLRTANEGGGL